MSTENTPVEIDNGGGNDFVTFDAEETAAFEAMAAADSDPVEPVDPAAAADPDKVKPAAEKPVDKNPQHVPLAALHEERNRRKELGNKLSETEKQVAELNGKLAILLKLKGGDAPAGEEQQKGPPSPEEDIFGAVKATNETVAQMQKRLDDQAAAEKQAAEQQTFVNNYRADLDAFAAKPETADFKEAYNFLITSRVNDLIAIGFANPLQLKAEGADIATIQAAEKALHDAIVADEFRIADDAFKAKASPASRIYALAKARGYQKKAAEGTKPKGEEALDRIEAGQRSSKSLADAGGGNAPDDMTAERLVNMPMAEFEAWTAKNPAKARALLGG